MFLKLKMNIFTDYPQVEYYGLFLDEESEFRLKQISALGHTDTNKPFHVTLIHRSQKNLSSEQEKLISEFILENYDREFELEVNLFKYSPKGSMFEVIFPPELDFLSFINPNITSGVASGFYPIQVPTLLSRNYKKKAVCEKINVTLNSFSN